MSIYNDANELIQDAVSKGLIKVSTIKIIVNEVELQTPNAINVINAKKWKNFLQNIINETDAEPERSFAAQFLQVFDHFEKDVPAVKKQIKDHSKFTNIISCDDITNLKIDLAKCETIDDIFKLMNIKTILKTITWKKPITVNNNLRYHANETNWYIAKKLIKTYIVSYSIYNPNNKEIARFSKLIDAKNNALNVINNFDN